MFICFVIKNSISYNRWSEVSKTSLLKCFSVCVIQCYIILYFMCYNVYNIVYRILFLINYRRSYARSRYGPNLTPRTISMLYLLHHINRRHPPLTIIYYLINYHLQNEWIFSATPIYFPSQFTMLHFSTSFEFYRNYLIGGIDVKWP